MRGGSTDSTASALAPRSAVVDCGPLLTSGDKRPPLPLVVLPVGLVSMDHWDDQQIKAEKVSWVEAHNALVRQQFTQGYDCRLWPMICLTSPAPE